ncbi:MAG: hypothetical protein KME30_29855 [Iphinoe sp. HA4291-MV1]|jgi:hypothetical protein|nr:hypothetical protein [Iphinoe sp. HA4291-MV1]
MTTPEQSSSRFRSATEFPKTIDSFSPSEANNLYVEMRECLIFTNRSRSQLIRRNEEHKLRLKVDVERLQVIINQLKLDKEQLAESNRQIVTDLECEIKLMAGHLEQLSVAFDSVSDIENPNQAQWSYLAFPNRFFKFLRAIKAIVLWWREEKGEGAELTQVTDISQSHLPGEVNVDEERRERPQMYTDSASQGRSLLDR